MDRKRREATLHKIQQLIHDKVMYAKSGLGLIAGHAYSAPYEDLKLKGE